jgi:hypothetical protein
VKETPKRANNNKGFVESADTTFIFVSTPGWRCQPTPYFMSILSERANLILMDRTFWELKALEINQRDQNLVAFWGVSYGSLTQSFLTMVEH